MVITCCKFVQDNDTFVVISCSERQLTPWCCGTALINAANRTSLLPSGYNFMYRIVLDVGGGGVGGEQRIPDSLP